MNSSGKALAAAVGLLASALLMVAVATIPPFAAFAVAVLDCVLIGATCALVICSVAWMVLKMRYYLSQRRQK